MTGPAIPIVIDTDPGVDDAIAIFAALAHPGAELLALTTVFGNVPVARATRNARALLALAGAALPVAEGAAGPLSGRARRFAEEVHGADGLGGTALPEAPGAALPEPAADLLARLCAERPGAVTIVALGPLTNLAAALARHPEIARTARGVVAMGGAVRRQGNVTAHAEYNFWQDPEAAARVLAADWPLTLVPLDLTEEVILRPGHLARAAAGAPRTGGFLARAAASYIEFHRRTEGIEGCHLHDPTAVLAALEPGLFETVAAPLEVATGGPEAGRVREVPGGPGPLRTLCLGGDPEAILARTVGLLGGGRLP